MLLNQKFAVILSLLTTLAAVNAAPQFVDFAAILTDAAPTPSAIPLTLTQATATINTASANAAAASAAAVQEQNPSLAATEDDSSSGDGSSGSLSKRDCSGAVQPKGAYDASADDSYSGFRKDPQWLNMAQSLTKPDTYTQVKGDMNSSIGAKGWYSLYTLKQYDIGQCQAKCDARARCEGFNLYLERDPKYEPTSDCPDPPSTTNAKCVLFGSRFTSNDFMNNGGYRRNFHVAIAGSVGYVKDSPIGPAPTFNGFTNGPLKATTYTINAPFDPKFTYLDSDGKAVAYNTYIRASWFKTDDIGQCATACQTNTDYTLSHDDDGKQSPCNYFTAYQLYFTPDGSNTETFNQTLCGFYKRDWSDVTKDLPEQYKNYGQKRDGGVYTIRQSYDYYINGYSYLNRTDLLPGTATTPDRGFAYKPRK